MHTPKSPSRTIAATLLGLFCLAAAVTGARRGIIVIPSLSEDAPNDHAQAPAPRSVEAALASMKLMDGFEITCVASEPMVEAPVAMAFDADGRLFVVEMRSYMPDIFGTGEKLPTNRISVLEDTDADGIFDSSRVFLDGLVLPRGVAPCYGGALVIEPPHLYFCKDTDGDGRADVKTQLLDGFLGVENPEHAGNGLLYGLDNWYHLSQHHTEFRFDGAAITTRKTPVLGQWGITMDDAGRLYYTPNSRPLLADLYPKHLGALNSAAGGASGLGENVAQSAAALPDAVSVDALIAASAEVEGRILQQLCMQEGWPGHAEENRLLSRLAPRASTNYIHHHQFPNLIIGHTAIFHFVQTAVPLTSTTSLTRMWLLLEFGSAPSGLERALSRLTSGLARRFIERVMQEDAAVYSAVQRGLASSRSSGVLGTREERIYHFHNYLKAQVKAA